MLHDLRFSLRSLSRQPGFSVVAILTLALGVALTTTIFSVADSVLYRPLPYMQPDQLYEIFGAVRGDTASRVSGAVGDYLAWRQTGAFASIGVFRYVSRVALTGGGGSRHVLWAEVDEQFLPTLGVQPALGRGIVPTDCVEGARPVVLISNAMWRESFGGDAGVLGKTIDVDSRPAEIVGVLPAGFIFPGSRITSAERVEILRPLIVPPAQRQDHNIRSYRAIGRLAEGVPVEEAQARLDAAQEAMKPLYRPSNVMPGAFDGVMVLPLQASMVGRSTRESITFLFLAACGVLLVAAVNLANMLLARGGDRERELAVRAAVGASRGRLARLLLAESLMLSIAGGALGLLLARVLFGAVLARLPQRLMGMRPPEIDVRVGLFAFAVAVAVGLVFGIVPALRLSRADFGAIVKLGSLTASRRGGWMRDGLVFAEMAVAVMLLGAGTLVLRSFANARSVDVGMDARHVLTLELTPPARIPAAAAEERAAFYRAALDAVRGVAGVQAAALTDNLLLRGGNRGSSLSLDGLDSKRIYRRGNTVSTVHVTPDYFRVVGVPLLRGSSFPPDTTGDEPVAITADRVGRFAGVDPLGREVLSLQKSDAGRVERYRVVGIAADVHERALDADPLSVFYLPFKAENGATLLVRGDVPAALAGPVRDALGALDRTAVVDNVATLDDLVYRSLAERRFNAFLYTAFSASALLLSAIGIYGVIAYAVSRRTREIGIRVALGATSQRVVALVTRRTALVIGGGVLAGLGGLLALGGALRALVFDLQPDDPVTLGGAVVVLIGVALAAAYVPARRATRVDPMVALRVE